MYSEEAVEVFLKDQSRLYDEPVAETPEEALESVSAYVNYYLLTAQRSLW